MKKQLARVGQFLVWFFGTPKRTAEEEAEYERMCDQMERDGRVW